MLQSLQVHICMSFIQRVLRIARLSSLGYANPQAIASPRWRRGARSARTAARAAWSGRPARRAAPRRRRRARASAPSCRGRSPRWASTASRPRPARCSTPGARVAPAVLAAAAVLARGARPDGGGGRERTAHLGADRPGRLGAVGDEAAAAEVLVEARRQPRAGALDHRPGGGRGGALYGQGPGGQGATPPPRSSAVAPSRWRDIMLRGAIQAGGVGGLGGWGAAPGPRGRAAVAEVRDQVEDLRRRPPSHHCGRRWRWRPRGAMGDST